VRATTGSRPSSSPDAPEQRDTSALATAHRVSALASGVERIRSSGITPMTARNVSNRSRCANPSWGHRRVVVRCGLPLRRLHALRALLDLADQLCDQLDLVGLRSSSARSRRLRASLFAWLLDGADPETVKGWRREVLRPVFTSSTRTTGRWYRRTVASVWA